MKKFLLSIACAFALAASVFAGGGGYYDEEFPNYSFVIQDLTQTYDYQNGNKKSYVVYECEVDCAKFEDSAFVRDEKQKITVPAGTQIEILSVDDELKFSHTFDCIRFDIDNFGVIYFDYLCNFVVKGKKYTGYIPGVYVSTDNESVTTDQGITYNLMSIWVTSASLFHKDLRSCGSLKEITDKIKEMQKSYMIQEGMWLKEDNRYLLSCRIINTKTKNISDVNPYIDKGMDFLGKGKIKMTYERDLPLKTIVLQFTNYNGGMGGGTFEHTWFALAPETGNTFFICQCRYVSAENWNGSHTISFDSRGATLIVKEYDDYGEEQQNYVKKCKQHPESQYIFDNYHDLEFVKESTESKFSTIYSVYYTTENLRLRKTEDTRSETLYIMEKRCELDILEIGKKETIDGITSNWVYVEVNRGKDKNGKEIPYLTKGWCFGGYLSYY